MGLRLGRNSSSLLAGEGNGFESWVLKELGGFLRKMLMKHSAWPALVLLSLRALVSLPNAPCARTCTQDCTARVWDVARNEVVVVVSGHTDGIGTAALSGDEVRGAMGSGWVGGRSCQLDSLQGFDMASGQRCTKGKEYGRSCNMAVGGGLALHGIPAGPCI